MLNMKLKVTDFLGIKEADLTFDKPLSMIQAENGEGKTSLIDAIRFLCGVPIRNTVASERDRLGHDEEQFSLEFTFGKKKLRGSASSVPAVAAVTKATGASRKAVPFFMEPAAFLVAAAKDLKALYSEVLNLDTDWKKEAVKLKCSKELLGQLSDEMKSALKEAAENRAGCKGGKGETPPKPEDPDVPIKGGTKKASEIGLDALEAAISDVEDLCGKLNNQLTLATENGVSDKERKAAKKELEQLGVKLEKLPEPGPIQGKLDSSTAQKKKLEAQYNELLVKQKAHDEVAAKMKEWEDDVEFCPKCKKKVERFELKEQGASETLEGQMAKVTEKIAHLSKQEEKLSAELEEADDQEIKDRMAELEPIAAPPVAAEDIEKLQEEIKTLDARLVAGRGTRDAVRDYQTALAVYKDAVTQHEQHKTEWKSWDAICKAIPQVEKAAVTAGLNPLRKLMAKHKVLEGVVEIGDDLEITYDGRSIDLMSKAERYIVSLAPYLATLELFKFPFVLIDDGDFIVTKTLRAKLQKVLRAIAKVKPVVFLQARPEDEIIETGNAINGLPLDGVERKPIEGIALYHVKDGTVERIAG